VSNIAKKVICRIKSNKKQPKIDSLMAVLEFIHLKNGLVVVIVIV